MKLTWYGTAPYCDGRCPSDETELQRDSKGDGEACTTGTKVLCKGYL